MAASDLNSDADERPLSPEQQRIVARVRWLMLISGLATVLGIAVVIGVIGYRVFRSDGSAAQAEVTAMLPKGARIVSTAVREDRIAATWVVKKPTSDGVVTSLELFDRDGEAMAMFFGERKPGKPELEPWRTLVAGLPRLPS